jgi:hypothetical protein
MRSVHLGSCWLFLIRVLPATAKSTAAKPNTYGPPKVQLEILARRVAPIPGLPLKRMVVNPQDIVMKARMYNPAPTPTEIEKLRVNRQWADRKKAQKEYDDLHRMTVPFRDAKWAFSTIMRSIRRGLTGEGFAPIEIEGKRLKLDITNGFVLDDGRALDRIVKIEVDPKMAPLLSARS